LRAPGRGPCDRLVQRDHLALAGEQLPVSERGSNLVTPPLSAEESAGDTLEAEGAVSSTRDRIIRRSRCRWSAPAIAELRHLTWVHPKADPVRRHWRR
jgi:hypothetical protein